MAAKPDDLIAFQGLPGAYSDLACRTVHPKMGTLPCAAFEDVFAAVREGKARLAMIPVENSVAGRVADIHHLLPESGLHIIGEHFQRVNHQLLVRKGTKIDQLKTAHSHVQALSQCRNTLRKLGLTPVLHADTAGAAKELSEKGDRSMAAIASTLAAEIYGLEILRDSIEDEDHNTTRFLIMAEDPIDPDPEKGIVVTSFVFRVRNVPAALYKALGGFATNGVNMTKLEILHGPADSSWRRSSMPTSRDIRTRRQFASRCEELGFFSREVKILGVYQAAPFRSKINGT